MNQQLISEKEMQRIAEYNRQLHNYKRDRDKTRSFAFIALIVSIPLWLFSLYLSGQTGAVNMATWFSVATFLTFVAATALTIAGAAVLIARHFMNEPYNEAIKEVNNDHQ